MSRWGGNKERAEESASETEERYKKAHSQEGTAIKKGVQSGTDPHTHCDKQSRGLDVVLDGMRYEQRDKIEHHIGEGQSGEGSGPAPSAPGRE